MDCFHASTEQTGTINWTKTEAPESRSGWIYSANELPASIELTFRGTRIGWIARTEPGGGVATVFINGDNAGEADLYSNTPIYNREVFRADNLEEREHHLKIVYERKGNSEHRDNGTLNIDMLIVGKADGDIVYYGADHPEISYQPYKYKHVDHPKGEGATVEEPLRMLSEDGCFLIMAHPNARLETSGENKGTQLWTSAGFTYDELDILYGNSEKGIPPLSHPPHALEIGNRGYDFSDRTGFQNAEEKWDYLLSQGHKVFGVATDDSHGATPFEGWSVIYTNAQTRDEITIDDVMESLFAGNFYSSQGPAIEIDVERNNFTIKADKPALIEFISNGQIIYYKENTLSATYTIKGNEGYIRGRVTREDITWRDVEGATGRFRSAWTNPLFVLK